MRKESDDDAQAMASPPNHQFTLPLPTLLFLAITIISPSPSTAHTVSNGLHSSQGQLGRALLSFRETPKGSNATFQCSPSGPCVPCLYSEKNDERYRCSETGYRIPLQCVEIIKDVSKKKKDEKKPQKGRSALEQPFLAFETHMQGVEEGTATTKDRRSLVEFSSVELESGRRSYITYRSCIPAVNEEKLSVLGFEGIMLCLLLVSGSFIYMRRKRATVAMPGVGAGRVQTNSRF
ncbi:hypothetical protein Scep_017647 [Stephania cephalantha]|uniref:Uncharacterized protein n=1 Tax=Stephania cephalantha TaxID=152367 RepID=A0AAP0IPZ3_9MAGN